MQLISIDETNCIIISKKEELESVNLTCRDFLEDRGKSLEARLYMEMLGKTGADLTGKDELILVSFFNDNGDMAVVCMGDASTENAASFINILKDNDEFLQCIFDMKNSNDAKSIDVSLKRYMRIIFSNMSEVIDFCKRVSCRNFTVNMLLKQGNKYHLVIDCDLFCEHLAYEFMYSCEVMDELPIASNNLICDNAVPTLSSL